MYRFLPIILVCLFAAGSVAGQTVDETLHVNKADSTASDENPGTRTEPLRTIQEAVDRAVANKRNFISTRVVVYPGTYRESIDLTTYTNVTRGRYDRINPDNPTPMIFEAKKPGTVIISGSEVWHGWKRVKDYYVHQWPFEWGTGVEAVEKRRELVFVNGQLKTQVMHLSELGKSADHIRGSGSYYVDDEQNKLYLKPAPGTDLSTATVEVSVRSVLWDQRGENNVTIRGFIFEHAATPWKGGQAAVRILSSDNVHIENCTFRWNNWQGIWVGSSEKFTILHSSMNHNGGQGWGAWQVADFFAAYTETSYNNWRGALGDHYGWNVGNKLMAVHGLVIKHHVARGNWSRGLWLDYDVADALLVDLVVEDNLLDGIWFEACQGPITLKNSVIRSNGRSGLRTTYTQNVTLVGNVFARNAEGREVIQDDSQIIIDGGEQEPGREVENFETGEMMVLSPKGWTITNNTIIGGEFHHQYAAGPTLIDTDLMSGEAWQEFIRTLEADHNTYYHPNRRAVFGFPHQEDLTLQQWQTRTGEDLHSVFKKPIAVLQTLNISLPEGNTANGGRPSFVYAFLVVALLLSIHLIFKVRR